MEERITKLEEKLDNLINLVGNIKESLDEVINVSNKNFQKIDDRFVELESKIDAISKNTNTSFEGIDLKLGEINKELSGKIDGVHEELTKINLTTRYEEEFKNLKIVKN